MRETNTLIFFLQGLFTYLLGLEMVLLFISGLKMANFPTLRDCLLQHSQFRFSIRLFPPFYSLFSQKKKAFFSQRKRPGRMYFCL